METTKDEGQSEPAAKPTPEGSTNEPAPRRPHLNDRGMERPHFLLEFPEDPALERLIVAFEAGNFALIRKEAEALARSTSNPAVRAAALELRRRIDPDPLAKYLLAISVLLLVILTIWAYRGSPH